MSMVQPQSYSNHRSKIKPNVYGAKRQHLQFKGLEQESGDRDGNDVDDSEEMGSLTTGQPVLRGRC